MCRVLKVSASGYYAWLDRPPSRRSIDDPVLVERIRAIHAESDATYGMPRVRAELIDQGIRVSGKRVARLMRVNAIRGISRRRSFIVTSRRDERQRAAPNLVKREFIAGSPNECGSLTRPTCRPEQASSSWPSCWMYGADASWAGPSASR